MATERPIRAISIRQPYVELILRGVKKNEFRSRPTRLRERVFLYGAQTPADDPAAWTKAKRAPGQLTTGLIVGTVEIVSCRWDPRSNCFAYGLKNPRRLKQSLRATNQPTPCFWRPRF